VNAVAKDSVGALLWRLWRDPAARATTVDVFAILIVVSLPWSTSLVAIFAAALLVAMAPFLGVNAFLQSLRRPICVLPIAMFALAAVGTLWSDAPWDARLYAVGPTAKLLMLPALFYHFERSARGVQVLMAFLVSCALLMAMSWIVAFDPGLSLKPGADYGIPVKNYIDQSQEFALCMFALAPVALTLFDRRRFALAAICAALILGFFVNMMFVVSARTALVYTPVLLVLFAMLYLGRHATALLFAGAAVAAVLVWWTSPYIRERIKAVAVEYQHYHEEDAVTSTGLRLEYWRKSLKFFAEAPLFGNGTGSTRQLFERDAIGRSGVSAEVIGNPHNQTLNVAVQWGLLGCIILYTMWFCHLSLFRGTSLEAWVGLLVVVQNMVSSLFNSHLFDFHEGWMYVLGVGVAGGMILKRKAGATTNGPDKS
jgi:O-antigen ligase